MGDNPQKILVIKLGALGDFIQALGPMKAIRAHHPGAHITLLTTKPFEGFAKDSGYFDAVHLDKKPKWKNVGGWLALRRWLNREGFERVYDLQNNDRTSFYFKLFARRPQWVGVANGASHRNTSETRTAGHAFDGHVQTLALAGIQQVEIDDLSWIKADIEALGLQEPYVILVPGSAPDRPEKRWPAAYYADLAKILSAKGIQPVLLGTKAEEDATGYIKEQCPAALDLTGKTNLKQIIALGRRARACVGNDTGPMHMIAPTGCPCITLFSQHSNPQRHYPKGPDVVTLQKSDLKDLPVPEVAGRLKL